jgi:hypothetical protein
MPFEIKPGPRSYGVNVDRGMVVFCDGLSEWRFTPDSATWLGEQLISYADVAAAQSMEKTAK